MAQGRSASAVDANTPSDARFVPANGERQKAVPSGTGGSDLAADTSSRTYRIEAIESQLSAFVGTKVEISGEVKPRPGTSRGDGSISPSTLLVEFVQKITATCSSPRARGRTHYRRAGVTGWRNANTT